MPASQICHCRAWPRPEAPTVRNPHEGSRPQRVRVVSTAAILQRAVFPEKPVSIPSYQLAHFFFFWSHLCSVAVVHRSSVEVRTPESSPSPSPHLQIRMLRLRKEACLAQASPAAGRALQTKLSLRTGFLSRLRWVEASSHCQTGTRLLPESRIVGLTTVVIPGSHPEVCKHTASALLLRRSINIC